jgi:hypothetical protein
VQRRSASPARRVLPQRRPGPCRLRGTGLDRVRRNEPGKKRDHRACDLAERGKANRRRANCIIPRLDPLSVNPWNAGSPSKAGVSRLPAACANGIASTWTASVSARCRTDRSAPSRSPAGLHPRSRRPREWTTVDSQHGRVRRLRRECGASMILTIPFCARLRYARAAIALGMRRDRSRYAPRSISGTV